MTGALGYEEYAIAGGDWGAHIGTRKLSRPLIYIR